MVNFIHIESNFLHLINHIRIRAQEAGGQGEQKPTRVLDKTDFFECMENLIINIFAI